MSHHLPVALALLCLMRAALAADATTAAAPAAPAPAASAPAPAVLEADRLSGRPGDQLQASGSVQLRQGPLTLQAERVLVLPDTHRLQASGGIELRRGDDRFSGSDLDLDTDSFEGTVSQPRFLLGRTQGHGAASRIDFLGRDRFAMFEARYTTCRAEDGDEPAWVLRAREVRLDIDANDGLATGAVLEFYGVPILGAPVLSFPVTDQRKSGWLPPDISTSSSVGFELGAPYYWNIAPELDATLTPTYSTKRGAGLGSELRYLQPGWGGELRTYVLPNDQTSSRQRWAARWQHGGQIGDDIRYGWQGLRVSDDDYWKDSLRNAENLTPRLLGSEAVLQRTRLSDLGSGGELESQLYARVQHWQTLQTLVASEQIDSPYRREPQLGARWRASGGALEWDVQTEVNRFRHEDTTRQQGDRAHLLGHVALPLGDGGWQLVPRLGLNAASYQLEQPLADGRSQLGRSIPTFSLDSRWQMERPLDWGRRGLTQTLEPRLLYVRTPWRDQSQLPLFDSAALDFNATTVFSDNAFSGIDRVSDANQITGGLTTRFIDDTSGAELARLGIAQRYLLSEQRITPDGTPQTQRWSDLLLLGSTSALPNWNFDAALQYNPSDETVARSIAGVRYSPGPFKVLSATYRLQRDVSEQIALGWQWPLYRRDETPAATAAAGGSSASCSGTLYGVGRTSYSLRDRRTSSSLVGLEYDSGCWIGRLVVERQSTGTSESNTKVMLQLELVGLSRIGFGSNPLSVLKDNIPGYQLLREAPAAAVPPLPAVP